MVEGFADAANWPKLAPDPSGASFASTGPHGHRKRMRDRLLTRGAAALADYEILEMLLFLGIPRVDTKPIAKAAINRFGSLPAVLRASRAQILSTPGLTPKCAEALAIVRLSSARITAGETRDNPVLSNWAALGAYLATVAPVKLRVLYLDNRNRLLADETGTDIDPAGTRQILKRALQLHSVSLLLAAWRDDAEPTRADRAALPRLRAASAAVAVNIHDLVLVTKSDLVSVQQQI